MKEEKRYFNGFENMMEKNVMYKLEKIENMLYMLLNDEQKEKLKDYDIEYIRKQKEKVEILKQYFEDMSKEEL